jgi:hypothetical protein
MVIIPRVGKSDVPSARAEPVARLKAIASHYGLTVLDLSRTFDEIEPARLQIAAWDDHPNALGHRRLFLALAGAIVGNADLYHRLFDAHDEARNIRASCSRVEACHDRMDKNRGDRIELIEVGSALIHQAQVDRTVVAAPTIEVKVLTSPSVALRPSCVQSAIGQDGHCTPILHDEMSADMITCMDDLPEASTGELDERCLSLLAAEQGPRA